MKATIVFILIFFAGLVQAQQSELISNTWYLQKMVSSNGVEVVAPNNPEVNSIPAIFNQTSMQTDVVTSFLGWILPGSTQPITNTTINYDEYQYAPNYPNCAIPSNCIFEHNYFFFFGYGFPMNYQITNQNNYLKLTLTNNSGNQAIYYSQNLGTSEFEETIFKVFPNPFKDILKISSKDSTLRIVLTDMNGKMIMNKTIKKNINENNFELDLSFLVKGIYLLEIDKRIITKIIKQ